MKQPTKMYLKKQEMQETLRNSTNLQTHCRQKAVAKWRQKITYFANRYQNL